MARNIEPFLQKIESILGHKLKKEKWIQTALTHRSFANEEENFPLEDNERLEFLGDAVIDLIIGDLLMKEYEKAPEGLLSKYRSSLVNEKKLADVSRKMKIGNFLRLGRGEEQSLGRKKNSILANTFEAVVGGIFLSEGFEGAVRFVNSFFQEEVKTVHLEMEKSDFKTSLQEWTQKNLQTIPRYELIKEEGPDHDKCFETEVRIGNRIFGKGRAKNKKESEQIAAKRAYKKIQKENKEAS